MEINIEQSTIELDKTDVRKILCLGIQTARGQDSPSFTTGLAARVLRRAGPWAAKKAAKFAANQLFGAEVADSLATSFDIQYPIEGYYGNANPQFVNALNSIEEGIGRGVVSPTDNFKRNIAIIIYQTLDAEVYSTASEFLSEESKEALSNDFIRHDTLCLIARYFTGELLRAEEVGATLGVNPTYKTRERFNPLYA